MEPRERKKLNLKIAKLYSEFFTSPSGKAVLADLSNQFYFNPFTSALEKDGDGKVDSHKTIYNEGSRDVIQHIYAMLWIYKNADEYVKRDIVVQEDTVEDILSSMALNQPIS